MIRKNLLKTFTLGLCMSALFAGSMNVGTAYAQSAGGASQGYEGSISAEEGILFEKQGEIDQYLFVDHIKEIEKMGFKVIYTGVAYNHVEIGITPFNDEYAAFLYDKFGDELVKVVDIEEAVLYDVTVDAPDAIPVDPDNVASPIMDMGDTPVSDSDSDGEALINEKEQLIADEEELLTIQIESIGEGEPSDAMDPELIRQTGIVEDIPEGDLAEENLTDDSDIRLVSAEDDMVTITSAGDIENEEKGLPTVSIIAIVAGGVLIIGGTAYASAKKRAVKKS